MVEFALYTANASMETATFVILCFLLAGCCLQKKKFATTRPLIHLILANMLLLICQIIQWFLARQKYLYEIPNIGILKRFLYGLDYMLYYTVAFCFFRYISIYIIDLYAEQKIEKKPPLLQYYVLAVWGIFISLVFTVLLFTEAFYRIDENGREIVQTNVYLILFLMGTLCVVFSSVTLIRNYSFLKKRGFYLLLAYVTLPNIVACFDMRFQWCISYLLMSFFTCILYINIDLQRGNLFLEQSAKLAAQSAKLMELRTEIMLSQIQPHFLYNTLSTISALCYFGNSGQAKEVVDKFSDYLRENMEVLGENAFIPFKAELEHIKTYLWIEQLRFGDMLKVEYKIGPKDFSLPTLTLQALVENAVKHGIRKKKGGGTVTIETSETKEEYLVRICDDGVGFDFKEKPQDHRSHVGIANVTERLQILCAGRCEFQSRKGEGTIVTVGLPKERKK